jgi:hypothetical protein
MIYENKMGNVREICQSLEFAGGAVKATDGAAAQEAIVECHGRTQANHVIGNFMALAGSKSRGGGIGISSDCWGLFGIASMQREWTIASKQNPKMKVAMKLRNHSEVERLGLFIVEGFLECLRAFEGGIAFEALFFCPKFFRSDLFDELVQRITRTNVDAFELSGCLRKS